MKLSLFSRSIIALTASAALLAPARVLGKQLPLQPVKNDPSFPQMNLGPQTSHGVGANLADCLTIDRKASLFFEYAREVAAATLRLSASSGHTTVFVPVDKAIMAMPTKPHQDRPSAQASTPETNVERFIKGHIVPSEISLPQPAIGTLLKDHMLSVESDGKGGWVVQPGNVAVLGIKDASNGRLVFLDGVVEY